MSVTAGCKDLPTGTDSFQLEADGQLWTAVVAPSDLPTAASWLAYGKDPTAAPEVAALESEAARARIEGDSQRAQELLAEAAARAVRSMTSDPGPRPFLSAVAALEEWDRTVRSEVDLQRAPELAFAVELVARERESARDAYLRGDARTAALLLTRAADRVREWSPQGVALRVLDRAVASLGERGKDGPHAERIEHLVRSAREELMHGTPLRAVQAAVYALQLADGQGMPEPAIPAEARAPCGEYSC
ncbi:MAG TPA: hypothetical protein VF167_16415 [Longimicrobiaceae bacterium]